MAGSLVGRSLAAPSADDLHGLLKLCGSEEATVAYLARIYNLPAEEIAPTFKAWLRELPPVAPPSRQRSAPPMVNSLMSAGAPIGDLNAVRGALSDIKAGGLARAACPARLATFVISDVPGDDPALVASGPTVPGPARDPAAILQRWNVPPPALWPAQAEDEARKREKEFEKLKLKLSSLVNDKRREVVCAAMQIGKPTVGWYESC